MAISIQEADSPGQTLASWMEIAMQQPTKKNISDLPYSCIFLFAFPHLFDPDANPVAHIPGDGFRPNVLKRGLSEAIKARLLFGEPELVAERTALHHLKKSLRVSLLDMMQQHLAGETEVAALAQGFERLVRRPDLEALSQPALPNNLYSTRTY